MEKKRIKLESLENKYIKWLSELSKDSIPIVGGKGANLAEMYNIGLPVPPAFCITAQAFEKFLSQEGLNQEINKLIAKTNVFNTQELEDNSKKIREMVVRTEIPEDMAQEILEAYALLSNENEEIINGLNEKDSKNKSEKGVFVAVRSSATTEDLADASFAGQQETYTNIRGEKNLLLAVKKCFASLYTARAVYYRHKKGFTKSNALLSVVVQKMINSEKSGVMFTKNPANAKNEIIIEAVYGLGEGIVSGKILPDHYVLSPSLDLTEKKIANKKIKLIKEDNGNGIVVKLDSKESNSQVLSLSELVSLGDYGLRIEKHYKKPQDIEFALEKDKIYIVQSRPITTLEHENLKKDTSKITGEVILTGLAASPGVASGSVKLVLDMKDLVKVKKGDILVTQMTNPDMVVTMQRAVAIITDEGGATSHAAIVSREMGIPCVTGTEKATQMLKDGMIVSVDGTNGRVLKGKINSNNEETKKEVFPILPGTKTKLKVLVDLPDFAERAAKTKCDSVGLMRLEGIIAEGGKHPLLFINNKHFEEYTLLLERGIEKISKYFKNIWIRTSDIRSDEYMHLQGAPKEKELNPMLGLHGIRFSLKYPQFFEAELLAIKRVAEKYPDKKFGVMFPQVISVEEIEEAYKLFKKTASKNMIIGAMIETPAAVQVIRGICKYVKFISFGTNDLTQFTLAIDRGNTECQYLYNELHPAVLSQLKRVIDICKEYNVESSICGQAGSKKEMVKELVGYGIDSISVNADMAKEISEYVLELENSKSNSNKENNKPRIIPINEEREEKLKNQTWQRNNMAKEDSEKTFSEQEEQKQEEFPEFEIGFDPFQEQK